MSQPASGLRVLVAPHNFEVGGSQINALELAAAVGRLPGFEVVLYAPDGELMERARATGLELHTSQLREQAPSPWRIQELSRLVARRGIDLVHAYEWAPTVDAAIGVAWTRRVPVLSTILSMDYPYFLPQEVPTIFGTRAMVETANKLGRTAFLLEPPVDTDLFRPSAIAAAQLAPIRAECGADDRDILLVTVGRLAAQLKLDGLLALIAATGRLAREYPVKLALVGDGPVRHQVEHAATAVNQAAGRTIVRLLGTRHDPLPYYAAADVVVGMGSSALRAMAVGKPLLVQGEHGFWSIADEATAPLFQAQGWYGTGDGLASVERCVEQLRVLLGAPPARRRELGRFGRQLIEREYSLTAAARHLTAIYRKVASLPAVSTGRGLVNVAKLSGEIAKYHTSMRLPWLRTASRRLRGL